MTDVDLDGIEREAKLLAALLHHGSPIVGEMEAQMRKLHGLLDDALWAGWAEKAKVDEPSPPLSYGIGSFDEMKQSIKVVRRGGHVDLRQHLPTSFLDGLDGVVIEWPTGWPVKPKPQLPTPAVGPYGANWGVSPPEKEPDPGYTITKSDNGAVTTKRFAVKRRKPDGGGSPFPPGKIGW